MFTKYRRLLFWTFVLVAAFTIAANGTPDTLTEIGFEAACAALLLEGLKIVVRLILKRPDYSFPGPFYLVMLPVASFAVQPLLALLGYPEFVLPADWIGWVQELLQTFITALVAVFVDLHALGPFVDTLRAKKQIKLKRKIS